MSAISTAYPANLSFPPRPAAGVIGRPWGFWSTLGWLAAAYAVMAGAGHVVSSAKFYLRHIDPLILQYAMGKVPILAGALFLVLVAHWRGPSARAYLGLEWPRWHHILFASAIFAALWLFFFGLGSSSPTFSSPAEQQLVNDYRAVMGNPTAIVFYWMVLVVIAPVTEEIIFRGFLQHGWSESRMGAARAILLSTLLFALAHMHYGLFGMALVFVNGLTYGVTRWYTGSTLLAIMIHAAWNLSCGIRIALAA